MSIKGKTNEEVDATGRGEAMACHAVALLLQGRVKASVGQCKDRGYFVRGWSND